ncbi:topoisomerase DNA-binding C4 zinc finger domain-containing protein [Seminibacterium arietis]|uniref:Topoisomerase DNA-binding C4 zinc finger domain-containing protein n=1 Tax=Seminibacterium arietis TaxID=1173502 RepID=A0ABW3I9Z6_9PAST
MNNQLFQYRKNQEYCPECGSILKIKKGKKGLFLGCSHYPECHYLKPLHSHSEHKIIKNLAKNCPKCGHFLQLKQGSYGMFIGCSDYPNCHFTVQEESTPKEDKILCPECKNGYLIARRGRQGKIFYGCSCFPKCKFILPTKPYKIQCHRCNSHLCILKKENSTHRTWLCINKNCQHLFETEI